MLRLKEIRDPVEGVVVDQNGAQKALLRLDVMRRTPVCRVRRTACELEDGRMGRGDDKAPLCGATKASIRLMHDSHKRDVRILSLFGLVVGGAISRTENPFRIGRTFCI